MWQFIYGSDEMFSNLEERARQACIRFPDQEMPPGTEPTRATVGFEVDPCTGRARLLVDRGLTYDGSSTGVQNWLADGSMTFDEFAQLRTWLGSELRDAFRPGQHPANVNALTLNEREHDLDDVGVKGFRAAMRLRCGMKDLPS